MRRLFDILSSSTFCNRLRIIFLPALKSLRKKNRTDKRNCRENVEVEMRKQRSLDIKKIVQGEMKLGSTIKRERTTR